MIPELKMLDPELIVTQGVRAFAGLADSGEGLVLSEAHRGVVAQHTEELPTEVRGWVGALAEEYSRTVSVGGNDVPVLKTVLSVRMGPVNGTSSLASGLRPSPGSRDA